MLVGELIETGNNFARYDIESRYTGELLESFDDAELAEDAYGELEVAEWAAHGLGAGFAADYLYIQVSD